MTGDPFGSPVYALITGVTDRPLLFDLLQNLREIVARRVCRGGYLLYDSSSFSHSNWPMGIMFQS
jgi:hypothetical protein